MPIPEPFELITVEERYGILFERIDGKSVLKRLVDGHIEPLHDQQLSDDLFEARLTARLLHQVHSHSVPHMKSQRENIKNAISAHSSYSQRNRGYRHGNQPLRLLSSVGMDHSLDFTL